MNYIKDKVLNLSDDGEDLLNGKPYSIAIKNAVLASVSENESMVIGLLGEWGIGKSSIINTAEELIKQDNNRIGFVEYDAWKYKSDSFRRSFLLNFQKSFDLDEKELNNTLYTNTTEEETAKAKFNFSKLGWLLIVLFGLIFLIAFLGPYLWEMFRKVPINSDETIFVRNFLMGTGFLAFLTTYIAGCIDTFKTTKSTPLLFSAEQFEHCFDKIVKDVINLRKLDKIVIVVDNIDRCDSETAYSLLSDIKTFLTKNTKVVFLVPTDDKALYKHLSFKFKSEHKDSAEFLRKIFNLEIRIKPFEEIELFEFTNKLNNKYSLGLSSDAINIISAEYASNPRRIIQFCNNLSSEIDILSANKVPETEINELKNMICKALIIREEWPEYYSVITKDYRALLNQNLSDKDYDNVYKNAPEMRKSLDNFLQRTYLFGLIPDETKLEKIVSNNFVFDSLPLNIKLAIKNYESEEIIKFLNLSKENERLLLGFVLEHLPIEISRGTWGTGVLTYFTCILLINSVYKISKPDNSRIEREFKSKIQNIIEPLFSNESSIELFIKYIDDLASQEKYYLLDDLIKNYFISKTPNESSVTIYGKLIKAFAKKTYATRLNEFFLAWYEKSDGSIEELALQNIDDFVSDELIEYMLSKIDSSDNKCWSDLLYLTYNSKSVPSSTHQIIIEKLAQSAPNYTLGNEQNVINCMNKIIKTIKLLDQSQDISKVLELYVAKTFKTLSVPNKVSYYAQIKVTIIDNIQQESDKSTLAEFLAYAYKFTNGLTLVANTIELFVKKFPTERAMILNFLMKIDITGNISNLKRIVFNTDWLKGACSPAYPYWIEKLLECKVNGLNCVDDATIKTTISKIISAMSTLNDVDSLNNLGLILSLFIKYRETIAVESIYEIVIKGKPDEAEVVLSKVTPQVSETVITKICASIKAHEKDGAVLKLIAKYGNKEQISTLLENLSKNTLSDDKILLEIYNTIPKSKLTAKQKKELRELIKTTERSLSGIEHS